MVLRAVDRDSHLQRYPLVVPIVPLSSLSSPAFPGKWLAAAVLFLGLAAGTFSLFAGNAGLQAADNKTPGVSPVAALQSPPLPPAAEVAPSSRGKNVDAEPSGIALSVDSLAVDEQEGALSKKKTRVAASFKLEDDEATARNQSGKKPLDQTPRKPVAPIADAAIVDLPPASVHSSLGEVNGLIEKGKFEDALAMYEKALEKDANDQDAWAGKAYVLQASGSPEAVRQLHDMVSFRPHSAVVHAALARAFSKQGDTLMAISSWNRAVELEPANKSYRLNLAVLHDRLGNDVEAITLYRGLGPSLPYAAKKRLDYLSSRISP